MLALKLMISCLCFVPCGVVVLMFKGVYELVNV